MSYTLLSQIREREALYKKKKISTCPQILIFYVACTRHFTYYIRTRETEELTNTERIGIINVIAFLAKIRQTLKEYKYKTIFL